MNRLSNLLSRWFGKKEEREPLSMVSNEVAGLILDGRAAYISAERKAVAREIRQAIKQKKARKHLYARQEALTQELLRLEAMRNG